MRKSLLLGLLVLGLLCLPSYGQMTNIYGAGVSYNNGGSPSVGGTALYAHLVSPGSGTYAFTVLDALPTSYKPFNVTTNVGVGVAQKLFTIDKVPIFAPTSAGVSFSGTNTGWAWNTGIMAPIKIKGYLAMPTVRVLKSSVSNGTGYQVIVGALFGWGK